MTDARRQQHTKDHVDSCRAKVDAQLAAYRGLSDTGRPGLDAALEDFEPLFFNHMVIALDAYFTHRLRTTEGKDGNPMNEVRLLSRSIVENGGELVADKQIKLKPETSVLGYAVGEPIRLNEDDFARLSDAYFPATERAYV
jgi:hypothetical protein